MRRGIKLIYPELSYKVVGILYGIHNEHGRFLREKQYADLCEKEFNKASIVSKREFTIGDSGNRVDFLIEESMILELKARAFISKEDYYQVQRYLQSSGMKLGLLVNFRNRYLKPVRVIKIETDARKKFIE
jgi:GxxExxY protein